MEHNGETWFRLPCPVFDGSCSVYPLRPTVCGSHKCNLLKSVEKNTIPLEKAKAVSDEMKALCQHIDMMLDELTGISETREIILRFHRLFSENSDTVRDKKFKKKYSSLLIKYAAYRTVLKKYYYDE